MREPTLSCPFSRLNPSARLLQSSSRGLPFPSSHRIPFLSSQPHTSHLMELSHPPRNQEPRTHPCPDFPNPFSTACLVEDSFAVGPAVKSLDVTAPHPSVPPARLFRPTFPSPLAPRPLRIPASPHLRTPPPQTAPKPSTRHRTHVPRIHQQSKSHSSYPNPRAPIHIGSTTLHRNPLIIHASTNPPSQDALSPPTPLPSRSLPTNGAHRSQTRSRSLTALKRENSQGE